MTQTPCPLCSTLLHLLHLPPPAHRLNSIMKTSLENHCTLTEVQRQRTLIVVKVGLPPAPSELKCISLI